MDLICPRCRCSLESKEAGACRAAICRRCGGIWLGAAAHATVQVALASESRAAADEGASTSQQASIDEQQVARCAECGEMMARMGIGRVEVDHCPAHGTWYDLGELEAVAKLLASKQQGADVELTDKGIPGPSAVEGGNMFAADMGSMLAAPLAGQAGVVAHGETGARFVTRENTGESLDLDVRGRRLTDDNAGLRIAQAHKVEGTDQAGPTSAVGTGQSAASGALDADGLSRAHQIAELCKRSGANRDENDNRHRRGRHRGEFGVETVLDIVGSLLRG